MIIRGKMLYLSEIHIDKFHLLKKPSLITFNRSSNYLLGRNGTGKTTIIEIIRSFFILNFELFNEDVDITAIFKSKDDEDSFIKVSYSSYESISKDNVLLKENLKSNLVDSRSKDEKLLITINNKNLETELNFYNGKSVLLFENKEINLNSGEIDRLIFVALIHILENAVENENYGFVKDSLLWFYNNSNVKRFSEGLENSESFFKGSFGVNIDSLNKLRFYQSDSIITQEMLTKKKYFNVFLKLKESLKSSEKDFEENIVISKEESRTLSIMCDILNVDDIRLNYKIEDINLSEDNLYLSLGKVSPSIVLNNGNIISYTKLSYGEKRMFHLIISFFESKSTVLLDEPVNGFHDYFIDRTIELCSEVDSQLFIANQNPILFDYIEVDDRKDFISKFVFCKVEDNKMNWNNPSIDEADNFMDHYDNNFFHVSKILKKLKLW